MSTSIPYLFARARQLLAMNQKELAPFLGTSERTLQRFEAERARPSPEQFHKLADAVRPHDAAIADALDRWAPRPPPPPPPVVVLAPEPEPPPPPPPPEVLVAPLPPEPPPLPAHVLVDSVVCAAAEVMAVAPQTLRPLLLAAFARAHEARLTAAEVVAVLELYKITTL